MNREEILAKIKSHPLLSQMYKIDQKKVDDVINFTLQCTDPVFKPVYRDVLVRMITDRDSEHHASAQERALIDFVDGLLPDMSEEDDSDEIVYEDEKFIWVKRRLA